MKKTNVEVVDIEDDEKKDEKLNSLITELKGNYIRFKKYKTFFSC